MASALEYPMAVHHNGVLYLVGYWGGKQWVRRSGEGGRTWLKYPGGAIQSEIAESDAERVALVKMETQGARLIVGVPQGANVVVYVSRDDGWTWEREGEV